MAVPGRDQCKHPPMAKLLSYETPWTSTTVYSVHPGGPVTCASPSIKQLSLSRAGVVTNGRTEREQNVGQFARTRNGRPEWWCAGVVSCDVGKRYLCLLHLPRGRCRWLSGRTETWWRDMFKVTDYCYYYYYYSSQAY